MRRMVILVVLCGLLSMFAQSAETGPQPELVMEALSGHLLTGHTPESFNPDDVQAWVSVTATDKLFTTAKTRIGGFKTDCNYLGDL